MKNKVWKIFSVFGRVPIWLQILIASILAITLGLITPDIAIEVKILGDVYLSLLKMIIAPLIFLSILTAIIGIGDIKKFGSLGGTTFLIYFSTTFLAIGTSLLFANIFEPGVGMNVDSGSYSPANVEGLTLSSFFQGLIPKHFFAPFVEGNAMQLVFLALLVGSAMLIVPSEDENETRDKTYKMLQWSSDVVMRFVGWIIAITPIGIFGIISALIGKSGLAPILDMWKFFLIVIGALGFHMLVVLPIIAYSLGKFNPYQYLLKMKDVLIFAFSTASSSATLPLNMSESVNKGGVKKKNVELVAPIGATINMDGTALYQALLAITVSQAIGMDIGVMGQLTIAITVVLASMGAAGIPGAGIIMLTTVFASVGLPIEAIGAFLVIDRFLDMFRTMTNISGDIFVIKIIDNMDNNKI